jgi:quercetin dioxygenase-like cupin family protein
MDSRTTDAQTTDAETTTAILVRDRDDGPATWALGGLFEQLASAAETAGAFGVSLVTQPAGSATPLHVHTREAEAFYMLDGNLTYQAGEKVHRLSAGSFIYLPCGVPHAFRVSGAGPARFLALVAPGGLMALYDEVGRPAPDRRLPEPGETSMTEEIQRWLETAPRYGLRVVGPPLPAEA